MNRTMTIGSKYPVNTTCGIDKLLGFNEGIGEMTKSVVFTEVLDTLDEIINNIKNQPIESLNIIVMDSLTI